MSQQSTTRDLVELTRRTFDAYNRRDFDAITRFVAPDAVYEAVSLGTTFEGVAAIRGFFEDWLGAYEGFEMEPEEILDLGNGVVFVVARLTGRPVGSAGSGLMRRRPLAFMWVEGLVARITAYADSVDEGRAAAERLAESRGRAVSQANVETMHEFVDAWNRGDLERFLALASPEWEWHPARLFPGTDAVYRGREGLTRFWNSFREPWESISIETERIENLGGDRVLWLFTFYGKGKESGVDVTLRYANVLTFRDGLVTHSVGYGDWESALEAVGLSG